MNESVEESFRHIRELAKSIDHRLDHANATDRRIRNELAGMFSVTIVATYEGIVRESLIEYAGQFHPKYQAHVEGDFAKMNARISVENLKNYSFQFGLPECRDPARPQKRQTRFHKILDERRLVVERRFRKDLLGSYQNLFRWRNDYAHERTATTTFGEVYEAHRVAQYVIRSFVAAFEGV